MDLQIDYSINAGKMKERFSVPDAAGFLDRAGRLCYTVGVCSADIREANMLLYILLGAQFAASFVNIICAKKNSDRMCRQTADRALFMIVNAAIACVFFAALNGFVIRLNAITWLYAAGFSLVAAASLR